MEPKDIRQYKHYTRIQTRFSIMATTIGIIVAVVVIIAVSIQLRQLEGVVGVDISAKALQAAQNQFLLVSGIILIILIPIVAGVGWFAGGRITRPIVQLRDGVIRIAGGERNLHIQIKTNDELEQLANSVNEMADQINDFIIGLEERVDERAAELTAKTEEMEAASITLEKRATQLRAISEVARDILSVRELNTLLPAIANTISEKFGFYHIGIFLNDENNEYAVLRGTNSEGGKRMLERGHRLRIGQVGIVGYVAGTGQPRIALDTDTDAVFFNNPDLPYTRSEMALPLYQGKTVLGILDVQSTESAAFDKQDIELLGTLADLVNIAIQNADLFASSQKATAEAQTLIKQYTRADWNRLARLRSSTGYRYSIKGSQFIENPIFLDAAKNSAVETSSPSTLAIPILVHEELIGNLEVKLPIDRTLNQDEIDIAEAIAERVALAVENARLLEETQQLAAKEKLVSEVSARIGSSISMKNVFQTAVEELGRILPGSDIVIQLEGKK